MRLSILLLFLASAVVFFIQNQQPIVLVFFGNAMAVRLPIAVWVFLFAIAGALTMAIVQLLNRFSVPAAPQNFRTERPPSTPPPPRPQPRSPDREPIRDREVFSMPARETTPAREPEWESKQREDDWNIEEPPAESTKPSATSDRSVTEEQLPKYEAEQTPQRSDRQGSIYSYTYREARDKIEKPERPHQESQTRSTDKSDRVYDANYRIITPPYQGSPERTIEEENDEDEDWV